MGSYASISINDSEVFWYKNEVNPEILSLFTQDEKVFLKGRDAIEYDRRRKIEDYDPEDIDTIEAHFYLTKANILRARLHTLGFNEAFLRSVFAGCRDSRIDFTAESLSDYSTGVYKKDRSMQELYAKELAELKLLTFEKWLKNIKKYILSDKISTQDEGPFEILDCANERIVLFAVILSCDPEAIIKLDVSDLYEGGWLNDLVSSPSDIDIAQTLDIMPPIILTEGVFDRQVLMDSIKILRPELVPYLKFLDTDYKTEGGAPAMLKMLKSFAAAGISNRILAILDNDTAALEAMTALRSNKLPSHFATMTLPVHELLNDYPAIGPQGMTKSNINGLAAAIELYLGEDVLRDGGTLSPVQWTGYSNKMAAYQGELNEKSLIQKRFKQKVKLAKSDPSKVKSQDWSGLELILDAIIHRLSSLR